ncbi:MAG: 23S rRNA (uracil(1939)-C(5))-methyltransferase RlmD [Clostridia bacterium]|nr:23S rRNA (uracil(1939)-C(5))-methyltransferase RlmD [Clostridia bacterium]
MLNKEYILNITSQGTGGEGVARVDGYTLFVHGAISGDVVRAKVTKLNKSYGFAKLAEIIEPSPNRCEPLCPAFCDCGGCQLMHMTYESQCEFKRQTVKDALLRIGGIDCEVDFVPCDKPTHYRNKMVFPFSEKGEWGFYKGGSHDVIPLKDCPLGDSLNAKVLNFVRDFCKREHIFFYNEKTHKGILRRVFTRVSAENSEMMVVISVNADSLPHSDKLTAGLSAISPRITSIILNVNKKRTNLVLGEKNITLYGKETLTDTLLGLSYEISPHSFFQINHTQTEKLYTKALEYAELDKTKTVFDLYCGIGTISLSAAKLAKNVIGVEIVPPAIENAKKNARDNNIENAEFYCAAAEDITPELIEKGIKPDTVILDPPRKGSDERTLSAIVSAKPERIVYVSCNPATLARDLKFLAENGYKTDKATAFDMFPHTSHVEVVCSLSKKPQSWADFYKNRTLDQIMEDNYDGDWE